jgi:ankyrin repeat protein
VNGANFEYKDYSGLTPLSWAIENGHETMVKLLLKKDSGNFQ